ncbi:MAG: bifunctional DNA-formamidopyrimidine glycosylase/DNA-(apurinic or apyrimidinic site) lyase [Candidatus Omnitrophica bacterium]|nr:bifunctional DNA-formamidopyrimidine glycosylase/DNA-(apurinic or apyrimidinic site) lyase [Candidatus Omnitrophota bacterium]
MPELPEVETIKSDLEKVILNKKITDIVIHRASVIKEPGLKKFKSLLINSWCKKIIRRGKLLAIEIITHQKEIYFLAVHMRMTGQLVYGKEDPKSRVSFKLSNGFYLCYNDQRTLGELRLVKDIRGLSVIKNMGPEPLGEDFKADDFIRDISVRAARIKPLLLDQKFIAGIGNIYAVEALFSSKINPAKKACDLNAREAKVLFKNIKGTLRKAIKCRGSSFSNYRDGYGNKGTFSENFYVYGRKGLPCLVCENSIQRIKLGGRGTYFCSKCQK